MHIKKLESLFLEYENIIIYEDEIHLDNYDVEEVIEIILAYEKKIDKKLPLLVTSRNYEVIFDEDGNIAENPLAVIYNIEKLTPTELLDFAKFLKESIE